MDNPLDRYLDFNGADWLMLWRIANKDANLIAQFENQLQLYFFHKLFYPQQNTLEYYPNTCLFQGSMFRDMSAVRDTVVLVRDDGPLQTIFVVPFMMSKNK